MSGAFIAQLAVNAATISAFYGLLAVSYVLMHAITARVIFSFGALAVWAGYLVINLALALMLEMPGATFLPLAVAVVAALISTTVLGSAIEQAVVRPLLASRALSMLVATVGVAILLEEGMRIMNNSGEVWLPPLSTVPLRLGGSDVFPVSIMPVQLAVILLACLLAGGLALLIARHPFGRAWRACAEDLRMAELCGIDWQRTLAMTFALAALMAASGGSLLALYYGSVSFYSGLIIGLKTLFVAVVGGLGSVSGAFLGAALLAFVETFWSGIFGAEYRDVASFGVLAGLLILFPQGLVAGLQRRGADVP